MYNGWFCDLERALTTLRSKVKMELFSSIEVNANADFIIKNEDGRAYIVTHEHEPKVFKLEGDWKHGNWIQI